ncbi:MAG TPA: aminoglycoside phosphotransferase family protein [Nannocystaceae bacterium]|nr:aminoglycoside phosphotransferase family protein [Nannocystaceae bacterium]
MATVATLELTDELARRLCAAWSFAPTEELAAGHCSRVYADATLVLKVPWRGEETTSGYVAALRLAGRLGPKVLRGDAETGAVLMERLWPGLPLGESSLSDEERIAVTVGFLRELGKEDGAGLPSLAGYYSQSCAQLDELLATTNRACLLHGDLHPFNILSFGEGWLPIDPKGVVGDPCFEPIAFLRNCIDVGDAKAQLARRIDGFASMLALDPERIAAWSVIDTIVYPDDGEPSVERRALMEALRGLLEDRGWLRWWPTGAQ